MDKELELLDSKNQIEDINLDEIDDLDTLKEQFKSLHAKAKDYEGKNRQLFERTKKSETELKELKAKAEDSEKKSRKAEKPDEELLKRLDKLALKTAGISEADEIELFEKWKKETSRDSDAIIDSPIFKKELEEIRTAKKNLEATSNVKGEPGTSAAKSTPEYWISKATKDADGKPLFPDDMPKEMYTKVLDKLESQQNPGKAGELRFYNS